MGTLREAACDRDWRGVAALTRPATGRAGCELWGLCRAGSAAIDDIPQGSPRSLLSSPSSRASADGQAAVCPLRRGSSPTRGVAPKQHQVAAFTSFVTLNAREGADGQAVVCPATG